MSSHPDADAFVRAILRDPPDVTTRLVFADWLEETGDPSNVAWAHFIRMMANVDPFELWKHAQFELRRRVADCALKIRETLTLPSPLFIAHAEPLQQFLPLWQFT